MKILDKLNNYVNENKYKVIATNKYVNIVNYKEIIDFNSVKISIKHEKGITIVNGKNLVVSKMLEEEILITGNIESIIMGNLDEK